MTTPGSTSSAMARPSRAVSSSESELDHQVLPVLVTSMAVIAIGTMDENDRMPSSAARKWSKPFGSIGLSRAVGGAEPQTWCHGHLADAVKRGRSGGAASSRAASSAETTRHSSKSSPSLSA